MGWSLTPNSYMDPNGAAFSTPNPVSEVFKRIHPGDTAVMAAGDYRRFTLRAARAPGLPPVKFQAPPLDADGKPVVRVVRDTTVGGTSDGVLYPLAGDVRFSRIHFDADDRACIFTEKGAGGVRNVYFNLCSFLGRWNAYQKDSSDDSLWGVRAYETGGWTFDGCKFGAIYKEHGVYLDGIAGNHIWTNFDVKHCGRTAFQVVNRLPPDGSMTGSGYGSLLWQGGTITDVCLEGQGGGSAFHLAGGMPQAIAEIQDVKVRLGCDPTLASPFNRNITGAIACKQDTASSAYQGGLGELHLTNLDSEVGTFWQGVGGARRVNVSVGDVDLFTMERCRLVQGPLAAQVALEVLPTVNTFLMYGKATDYEIVGKVKYRNVQYDTFAKFATAHGEVFS